MNKHSLFVISLVLASIFSVKQLSTSRDSRAYLVAKNETLIVCHVPTDPDETREINAQTLDVHLGHGDYLGACQTPSSSSSVSSISISSSTFSSEPASSSSLSSESTSSTSSISSDGSSSSTLSSEEGTFITICHIQSGQTLDVPENAAEAHLNHGDYLGACQASSSSSSSSSSISTSSSGEFNNPEETDTDSEASRPGVGGGQGNQTMALARGHGLREHAAALDLTLQRHGLHKNTLHTYTFFHEEIHPAAFASEDQKTDWILKTHAVTCSMYRYLQRIHELRPGAVSGYVDWVAGRLAEILGQDAEEIKAALLGFPSQDAETSGLIRSINVTSCQANPYVSGIVLDNDSHAAAEDTSFEDDHDDEEHSETGSSSTLQIQQIPAEGEIAFSIMQGDEMYTEFGPSNQKAMHSMIVRNDLQYSHHIHPLRDESGLWRMPFVPPAPGTYWIFADFLDRAGKSHVLRFTKTYEGDTGVYGLEKNTSRTKRAGKYFVELQETLYSDGEYFVFNIRDKLGYEPLIEKSEGGYRGHGVLISTTGEYIHVHPSPAGDAIIIHIPKVKPGYYRLYMEFKIQGELYVAEFDWIQK